MTIKTLSPQARTVYNHMRTAGSITQREAILDHSVQSLTRRITEINSYFKQLYWPPGRMPQVAREDKRHPLTNQRYARYSLVMS